MFYKNLLTIYVGRIIIELNNYLPRLLDNPGRQQIGLSPMHCPVDAEWIIHHLYYHRKRRI